MTLAERQYIDLINLKKQKPKSGEVIIIENKNRKLIALTIKPYLDTNNLKSDMDKCLKVLSRLIDKFEIKEIEIIRDLDMMTQIQVFKFIESLNALFSGKCIKATFYKDNLKLPPVEERFKLIKQYHCNTIGAHYGMAKTYHRIANEFYWKHMRQEINHFIKCCQICQKTKIKRSKLQLPMCITDTPVRVFDKISIDLHGKLKESKGYFWILTVIDLLTKWFIAIPLKNATAYEVAKALFDNVIADYGPPKALLSDLGSQFQSRVMKAFADIFHIEKFRTTAYHPQSSGSIERSHASLVDYIRIFVGEKGNWSDYLKLATFAFNTTVHQTTNMTPFELLRGYKARIPSSFEPKEKLQTYGDYFADLIENLVEAQTIAGLNSIQRKYKSKFYYDRRRNAAHFHEGEMVYIINHRKLNKHEKTCYLGPCEILKVFPDSHNVQIQMGNLKKQIHMNEIRRAYQFIEKENLTINRVTHNEIIS